MRKILVVGSGPIVIGQAVEHAAGPLAAVEADPGAVNVHLYRCAPASGDDEAARGAVRALGLVHRELVELGAPQ